MPTRRRVTFWLVAVAAILTLGHLVGPHSDLHGLDSAHHVAHEHDSDTPAHDDDPACGQMLPLYSCDFGTAAERGEPSPVENWRHAAVSGLRDADVRSPPDPVAHLQVNRV